MLVCRTVCDFRSKASESCGDNVVVPCLIRLEVSLRRETSLPTCLRPALEIGGRILVGGVVGVGSLIGQILIASP